MMSSLSLTLSFVLLVSASIFFFCSSVSGFFLLTFPLPPTFLLSFYSPFLSLSLWVSCLTFPLRLPPSLNLSVSLSLCLLPSLSLSLPIPPSPVIPSLLQVWMPVHRPVLMSSPFPMMWVLASSVLLSHTRTATEPGPVLIRFWSPRSGPDRGQTGAGPLPGVSYGAFPLWGKTQVSFLVSIPEVGLWSKQPPLGPGVGQGRIGAELGTLGMEYNATIKPLKSKTLFQTISGHGPGL